MSGAPPPQPGALGTDDDPLDIETGVLELLNNTAGVATVENLVGVAADSTSTDGTLVYPTANGAQGVPTDLAVRIDGVNRPVTAIEYADSGGVRRPVTQWHLGSRGTFLLTLDSLAFIQPAAFDVSITGTNGPVAPGNTLDVTADVSNSGGESATQTVTLDINNSVGQVDSTSVTLSGGGSTTQTLSWAVPSGQTKQDYTATVSSDDDSVSQTVTVESAISGSVVHQHPFDEGSGATVTDKIGSIDGTLSTGASWASDPDLKGGFGVDTDSSDGVSLDSRPGTVSDSESHSIAITVDKDTSTGSTGEVPFHFSNGSWAVAIIMGATQDTIQGGVFDGSSFIETREHPEPSPPYRIRLGIGYDGSSSVELRLNANTGSPSSAFGVSLEAGATYGADSDGGNDAKPINNGVIDNPIIYSELLSDNQWQKDYNNQPWA